MNLKEVLLPLLLLLSGVITSSGDMLVIMRMNPFVKVNQFITLVQIAIKSSFLWLDQGNVSGLAVVGVVVIVIAIGGCSGGRLSSGWFCSGCS